MLKQPYKYTSSWFRTSLIALFVGGLLAFILIYLQPMDTYQSTISYKKLKLAGYGVVMFVVLLLLHLLENWIYKRQNKQWFLFNEIGIFALGIFLMCFASYLHNAILVNNLKPKLVNGLEYVWYFALPYFPLMLPLWMFLRRYWGQKNAAVEQNQQPTLLIIGNNNK